MFKPDIIVTGATGLIGRWLVPELTKRGKTVAILVRNSIKRTNEYRTWVKQQGGEPAKIKFFEFDLTTPDESPVSLDISAVGEVYHLAAVYKFGLEKHEARKINVLGSMKFLNWCNEIPNLRRFIFVSGYLAATHAKTIQELAENEQQNAIERHYKKTGAYEASKVEENIVLQKQAKSLNIPYTIINPSAIIGDSKTGQTSQFIGPADLVRDLYFGKLPALVGGDDIFVPLISVDYVAKFMARISEYPDTVGQSYWLLDQTTPNLPGLVKTIANHLGVSFPTKSIPKPVVAVLPKAISGTNREALSFLTNLRYDTSSAEALAKKMNISMPDFGNALLVWINFLVAKNFGSSLHQKPGYLTKIDGNITYLTGELNTADCLLLHGLPFDSQSWVELEGQLEGNILRADLPGHGRNGKNSGSALPWMEKLLENNKQRPVIVAHSIGCEYAIRYALAHPDKISKIILISPFFLQKRASPLMRNSTLFSAIARIIGSEKILKTASGLSDHSNPLIASATKNLARPGKLQRFTKELSRISAPKLREELQEILRNLSPSTIIITGENDPLLEKSGTHPVYIIPGAGHNPQMFEAEKLAKIINSTIRLSKSNTMPSDS